ncbi:MAG: peptidylprolyl isomerase [Pseudomonadota bacterium]
MKKILMKIQTSILTLTLVTSFLFSSLFCSVDLCRADSVGEEPDQDKVVAKVNGKPIAQSMLTLEVNKDLEKYNRFGMKKAAPELMKTLNEQALGRIIDNEVLSQEIRRHDISDIEQKALKELDTQKKRYETKEAFERYLKSRQLTEQSLLVSLQNKIVVNAYMEKQGILHFEPPKEEILAFYEQNKENFKKKERVDVQHILVQVEEGAKQSEKDAAFEKGNEILQKIQAGENFAALAGKYSDCLMSKERGGQLGFIEKGFMPPEFDEIAFSIEQNTTSKIFATRFGYHILQVLAKEPAGYVPVDQVSDFIKKFLEEKHVNKMRMEHIKELRKQANIEIYLN